MPFRKIPQAEIDLLTRLSIPESYVDTWNKAMDQLGKLKTSPIGKALRTHKLYSDAIQAASQIAHEIAELDQNTPKPHSLQLMALVKSRLPERYVNDLKAEADKKYLP